MSAAAVPAQGVPAEMVVQMIEVGEESGQISQMLEQDRRLLRPRGGHRGPRALTSAIEPIMVAGHGRRPSAAWWSALYLPMFTHLPEHPGAPDEWRPLHEAPARGSRGSGRDPRRGPAAGHPSDHRVRRRGRQHHNESSRMGSPCKKRFAEMQQRSAAQTRGPWLHPGRNSWWSWSSSAILVAIAIPLYLNYRNRAPPTRRPRSDVRAAITAVASSTTHTNSKNQYPGPQTSRSGAQRGAGIRRRAGGQRLGLRDNKPSASPCGATDGGRAT